MKSHLEINSSDTKNAPVFAKIAIWIYWAAALLTFYYATHAIFTEKLAGKSIFTPNMQANSFRNVLIILLSASLAFAVLQLFLAFKLTTRKNWARIIVVIISSLMAAALLYQAYLSFTHHIPFLPVLKGTYWLVAEIVAASLLLLPKSRRWFLPKRTGL